MKKDIKKIVDFYYEVDDEKIKQYKNMPAGMKLQWLKEALEFLRSIKKVEKKTDKQIFFLRCRIEIKTVNVQLWCWDSPYH